MEIPKPEDFVLVEKRFTGNSNISAISYRFKTTLLLADAKKYYRQAEAEKRLSDNPIVTEFDVLDAQIVFRSGNRMVSIDYIGGNDVAFAIRCSEPH